jgi:hypothetical protein
MLEWLLHGRDEGDVKMTVLTRSAGIDRVTLLLALGS